MKFGKMVMSHKEEEHLRKIMDLRIKIYGVLHIGCISLVSIA